MFKDVSHSRACFVCAFPECNGICAYTFNIYKYVIYKYINIYKYLTYINICIHI